MDSRKFMTPAEVAKILGTSPLKIRSLIRAGKIPAVVLGPRTRRIPSEALFELLNTGRRE